MSSGQYPTLRRRVVLVEGPAALGVYDLNNGAFHRLTLGSQPLLRALDGTRDRSSFSAEDDAFIDVCGSLGLVEMLPVSEQRPQTQLGEVLRPLRPVRFAWIEVTSQCNQSCKHCFLGTDLN